MQTLLTANTTRMGRDTSRSAMSYCLVSGIILSTLLVKNVKGNRDFSGDEPT